MLDIGFTSIKTVIARLLLNPYIKEDFNEIAAIELFGECLRLLELKEVCQHNIELLKLKNYKASLPSGTKRIMGVLYSPVKCVIEKSCDKDNQLIEKCTIHKEDEVCKDGCKPIIITKQMYEYNSVMPSFHLQRQLPNYIELTTPKSKYGLTQNSYIIRNNMLETTFKEGDIILSYLMYPLDEEGYPLISDDAKVIDCLINYYYYKIMQWRSYSMYDKNATILSREAEARFLSSLAQVRGKAKMPSLDKLKSAHRIINNRLPSDNYFGTYG